MKIYIVYDYENNENEKVFKSEESAFAYMVSRSDHWNLLIEEHELCE